MIDFLYNMARAAWSYNVRLGRCIYKINKLIVNLLYPLTQRFRTTYGLDQESRLIVSMTSYPDRIDTVWLTVATLLNQTCQPGAVILWLAEDQFPDRILPKSLERLRHRGLTIRFCEDLKPHKKYYYVMQEYPGAFIVTVDDDTFYPETLLGKLCDVSRRHPGSVVCHVSNNIRPDGQGGYLPYDEWNTTHSGQSSDIRMLPVGCGGILYPPGCLPGEAFNPEAVRQYLYTDDLWLKCMEVLSGTPCVNEEQLQVVYFNNIRTQQSGLWRSNTMEENRNDLAWRRLMMAYPAVNDRICAEDIQGMD